MRIEIRATGDRVRVVVVDSAGTAVRRYPRCRRSDRPDSMFRRCMRDARVWAARRAGGCVPVVDVP